MTFMQGRPGSLLSSDSNFMSPQRGGGGEHSITKHTMGAGSNV